jgi:DNA-binding NtrC family response regulator
MSGLETLKTLRDRDPNVMCIMITAFGTIRSAIDATRSGAFDYLTKPFDNDELLVAVDRALDNRRLTGELTLLRAELETRYGFNDIVGISPSMREVFREMAHIAPTQATVLILGESGTGKELVARAIHRQSARSKGPFLAVNCSAIPSTLVEAEFFGAERGAYTDAKESRPGRFEQAHGGTLFLDEVGDLPLEAQAKLLRVLQEREVTRLGSGRSIKVDVRVLAATNKNLRTAVTKGLFREDLLYRLDVLTLNLPPLRDRGSDVSLLVDHLVDRLCRELGVAAKTVSPEAQRLLLTYDWPGNIRELENTLRRAIVLAEDSVICGHDLPGRIRGAAEQEPFNPAATLAQVVEGVVARVERGMIQATLAEMGGSRVQTAERLGINRKTLFKKLKLYGLAASDEIETE